MLLNLVLLRRHVRCFWPMSSMTASAGQSSTASIPTAPGFPERTTWPASSRFPDLSSVPPEAAAGRGAGDLASGVGQPCCRAGEPRILTFQPVETIADLQRCYEFRLTIEPAAAALAAVRRSEAHLVEIAKFLAMLRDATERLCHREDAGDFQFHLAITAASNNQYLRHLAAGLEGPYLRGDALSRACR